jgi:hypothetical protein
VNQFLLYFRFALAAFYAAIGIYITLSPEIVGYYLDPTWARVFGAIVFIYGLFRGYTAYSRWER